MGKKERAVEVDGGEPVDDRSSKKRVKIDAREEADEKATGDWEQKSKDTESKTKIEEASSSRKASKKKREESVDGSDEGNFAAKQGSKEQKGSRRFIGEDRTETNVGRVKGRNVGKGEKRERDDGAEGALKVQKMGGWHARASLLKANAAEGDVSLVLFYQYVEPLWSKTRQQEAIDFVVKVCAKLNLGGRVRVAREGFNATLSGGADALREFARSLGDFDIHFKKTDFKYIDGLDSSKHFKDLKVVPVEELVFYGVRPEDGVKLGKGGEHLEPREYHEKMQRDDAVIVDVRNFYESAIGRFQKQIAEGGAKLIDPKMRKSTDFTAWLNQEETKKQLQGKEVLMYCTGGVRCERASALIKNQLGDNVKGVYQLQGGIEKYLQEFPDGGFWAGKNKVFDKREACGVGDVNGTGGVIKEGKKGKKGQEVTKEEVLGNCCVCDASWDRYVGKKKCYACGVPVLMCSKCLEKKPDKGNSEQQLSVRCPLCKEEGRVTAASDVEWTDNGIVGKVGDKTGTVLKWGAGHAKSKKEKRQHQRAADRGLPTKDEPSSRVCKFGAKCWRESCWFAHPDREQK